jgi:hypothetical protein
MAARITGQEGPVDSGNTIPHHIAQQGHKASQGQKEPHKADDHQDSIGDAVVHDRFPRAKR